MEYFDLQKFLVSVSSAFVLGITHYLSHEYFGYSEPASQDVGLVVMLVTFAIGYAGMMWGDL